jgi:hypothetical protein
VPELVLFLDNGFVEYNLPTLHAQRLRRPALCCSDDTPSSEQHTLGEVHGRGPGRQAGRSHLCGRRNGRNLCALYNPPRAHASRDGR